MIKQLTTIVLSTVLTTSANAQICMSEQEANSFTFLASMTPRESEAAHLDLVVLLNDFEEIQEYMDSLEGNLQSNKVQFFQYNRRWLLEDIKRAKAMTALVQHRREMWVRFQRGETGRDVIMADRETALEQLFADYP